MEQKTISEATREFAARHINWTVDQLGTYLLEQERAGLLSEQLFGSDDSLRMQGICYLTGTWLREHEGAWRTDGFLQHVPGVHLRPIHYKPLAMRALNGNGYEWAEVRQIRQDPELRRRAQAHIFEVLTQQMPGMVYSQVENLLAIGGTPAELAELQAATETAVRIAFELARENASVPDYN